MHALQDVDRGDQRRSLAMSTIAFTVCFAVWTIFSIIGIRIRQELGLSETQFGLLIGTPILTGSLIRVALGIWTDLYGGRLVFTATMLAAAVATFLLSYAHTYPEMLVAALGVGIAGGSFAVGVAYVSRWFPARQQGTALGIFGAGNVGAAVTKFLAPFVLVAFGWQTVAEVWAAGLVVMAIIFWFTTKDDPVLVARRRAGIKAKSGWLELEPLKNVQVWRFSIYYFFVFGAFVALALWLPQYLVNVYGLDIRAAGMIAALFSIPASLFRAYGGHLSDVYGARKVLYWTLLVSVAATFLLSYPPTDYVVHGSHGPIAFHLEMGLIPFAVTVFVLGFFMALGKAAVYKHIPVYYPDHVGSVGGLVGMIGGLGGFVLPIVFGILLDLTGLWTSCFMALFVLVVGCADLDAPGDPPDGARGRRQRTRRASAFPGNAGHAEAGGRCAPERHGAHRLASRRSDVLGKHRAPDRAAQSLDLDPGPAAVFRDLAGLVCRRRQTAAGRLPLLDRSALLARGAAGHLRRDAAHLLFLHGADLRRAAVDDAHHLVAHHPGARHRLCGAEPRHALHRAAHPGASLRVRWRQFRLFHGQHLLLLPEGGEGQCARPERRPRQSRRQRRPIRRAACDHGRNFRLARWRSSHGQGSGRRSAALAAERRLRLRAFHRALGLRGLVRHERHRFGQSIVRRAGDHLPTQTQLDHVLALHRHLRFVHRLFRRLSAAGEDPASRMSTRCNSPFSVRSSARCRAPAPAGSPTNMAAPASPFGFSW